MRATEQKLNVFFLCKQNSCTGSPCFFLAVATLYTILCSSYNLAIFIYIFINFCCQTSDKQKSRPINIFFFLCRSELSIRSLLCEGDGFQINTICTLWDRLDIQSEWSQSGIGGDRKFPSLLYCHRTREKLSIWFSLSKPKLDASSVSFIHWKTFIETYFWGFKLPAYDGTRPVDKKR